MDKVNVDLGGRVAFKERYNMPVIAEAVGMNSLKICAAGFHERVYRPPFGFWSICHSYTLPKLNKTYT